VRWKLSGRNAPGAPEEKSAPASGPLLNARSEFVDALRTAQQSRPVVQGTFACIPRSVVR
jgi:hypothetical protein